MAVEIGPLIERYGYAAAFIGPLLEGESFLILAGVAAHRGYLSLSVLVAVGAVGAFCSDNIFFAIGRVLGPALPVRFPRLGSGIARANSLVARLPNTAVIGIRFLYGMRAVGPAIIGAGSMPWLQFMMLDTLAASLWSACWIGAGYVLGGTVEYLLDASTELGRWLVCGIVAAGAIVTLIIYARRRNG